jgi:hypothetical protein
MSEEKYLWATLPSYDHSSIFILIVLFRPRRPLLKKCVLDHTLVSYLL